MISVQFTWVATPSTHADFREVPGQNPQTQGVPPAILQTSILKGVAQPTIVANGHVIDPQVVQSLISAFSEQASKAGVKVQPDGAPITITVQEYSARPVAARWLAGALAGSDHIKAAVALGETTFVIEDTARSIATGSNGVAKNVGVQAVNGVAAVAGLAQSN